MDIQKDKNFAALPEVAKLYQACKERDLTIAEREYLKGARDAWQAAKAQAVPELTDKMIVAIELEVESQLKASAIDADPFRLDGEKIWYAALEAQEPK